MTTGYGDLESAIGRLCGTCGLRKACSIEGAARFYEPEHRNFPMAWQQAERGWRCTAYQAPRLLGIGRIDDPTQAEMFPKAEMSL